MGLLSKYGILGILLHAISPIALIWSLNTLFNIGIPFSLKTWFAALILIYVVRFHMGVGKQYQPLVIRDSKVEDEEEEESEAPEAKAERLDRLRENLERYQKEKKVRRGERK